jgi:hypothetical protein
MAETATSSNNKSVSFRKTMEREMSWNSDGITHSSSGKNPPGTGKSKVATTTPPRMNAEAEPVDGKPKTTTKKPSRRARKTAKGAVKRGLISEKAAKRHLGGY